MYVLHDKVIQSLFYASIKLTPADDTGAAEADLKKEMVRLREAQAKLGATAARPTMARIDQGAARRFILHGIGPKGFAKVKNDEEGNYGEYQEGDYEEYQEGSYEDSQGAVEEYREEPPKKKKKNKKKSEPLCTE